MRVASLCGAQTLAAEPASTAMDTSVAISLVLVTLARWQSTRHYQVTEPQGSGLGVSTYRLPRPPRPGTVAHVVLPQLPPLHGQREALVPIVNLHGTRSVLC